MVLIDSQRLPDFDDFCSSWLKQCRQIGEMGVTKQVKGRKKGQAFEEKWQKIFEAFFSSSGWKLVQQINMGPRRKTWDFGLVKSGEMAALFEVKSHGFYGYKSIRQFKEELATMKVENALLRVFYITFRETNTYDRKVREILGDKFVRCYYRLSDSGDGTQLLPVEFYRHEWNRLEADLQALLHQLNE